MIISQCDRYADMIDSKSENGSGALYSKVRIASVAQNVAHMLHDAIFATTFTIASVRPR